MEAIKGNMNTLLNGCKQFIVPVYQRPYSWEKEQCEKLWDDIVEMQNKQRAGHFIGSIVNVVEQDMPTGVQKFMIVYGQQRMVTLTLLFIAIRDYLYKNPGNTNPNTINGMCLKNEYESGDNKYKLLLTERDNKILRKLIDRFDIVESKSRLKINYDFFSKKIETRELNVEEILTSIGKLQIVNITLSRETDDPQLIFESLNSTGMDLSKSDLIRNYMLMGLKPDEQDSIYEKYWGETEKLFDEKILSMDKFFKHFFTVKNKKIPVESKIYEEFKSYYNRNFKYKSYENVLEFSKYLYNEAKNYTNIYYAKSEDKELNNIFKDINNLKVDVELPFLLKVYKDYNNCIIDKNTFIKILKICESYIFRRSICEVPTNSLNTTFTNALKSIKEDDYLNSIKLFFVTLDSYKKFPTDKEFIEEFKYKDIYNMRIAKYILSKFENHNNKASIVVDNYTIEHIMPQNKNLNKEWIKNLGENYKEIQNKYLNTIGNLTLTAYNSEMSDKSFSEKLNMQGGFKESALKLNSYVVKQEIWNKESIENRADELCNLAKKIWAYPQLPESELQKIQPKINNNTELLNPLENILEENKRLYKILEERILNISKDITIKQLKKSLAYKVNKNFVEIYEKGNRLRLFINLKYNEVIDKNNICIDKSHYKDYQDKYVEIWYDDINKLDDIMDIIMQSYNKQLKV